jgi:hypothetical protein
LVQFFIFHSSFLVGFSPKKIEVSCQTGHHNLLSFQDESLRPSSLEMTAALDTRPLDARPRHYRISMTSSIHAGLAKGGSLSSLSQEPSRWEAAQKV